MLIKNSIYLALGVQMHLFPFKGEGDYDWLFTYSQFISLFGEEAKNAPEEYFKRIFYVWYIYYFNSILLCFSLEELYLWVVFVAQYFQKLKKIKMMSLDIFIRSLIAILAILLIHYILILMMILLIQKKRGRI
jgi:hypothetical protein